MTTCSSSASYKQNALQLFGDFSQLRWANKIFRSFKHKCLYILPPTVPPPHQLPPGSAMQLDVSCIWRGCLCLILCIFHHGPQTTPDILWRNPENHHQILQSRIHLSIGRTPNGRKYRIIMDHCTLMVPYNKISAPSKTNTSESKNQFSPIGLHELVVSSHLSKALKYLYRLILVLKGSCLANKEVPKERFDLRALDSSNSNPAPHRAHHRLLVSALDEHHTKLFPADFKRFQSKELLRL